MSARIIGVYHPPGDDNDLGVALHDGEREVIVWADGHVDDVGTPDPVRGSRARSRGERLRAMCGGELVRLVRCRDQSAGLAREILARAGVTP